MCGKNKLLIRYTHYTLGSPPRVREELDNLRIAKNRKRITPACAGRTPFLNFSIFLPQDHPRVCGKNLYKIVKSIQKVGSPPRVREELHLFVRRVCIARITPACAGRTRKSKHCRIPLQDHPRVCGKNTRRVYENSRGIGSPPRVREERWKNNEQKTLVGITPACAGRTEFWIPLSRCQ